MEAQEGSQGLRKGPPTEPRNPDHGPGQLHGAPSAPHEGPREPQEAQDGAQDGRQRPKIGSKRPSEGWTERIRTKQRQSASRLGGSTIFEGRTAPKRAPNRPNLAPKSAQKASRSEDSTSAAEDWASRPEIRPRAADSRLSRRPETTATQTTSEVKIDLSGQSCD